MKKGIRTNLLYLEDIQTSMIRIAEYIKDYNLTKFKRDLKTVDAVIRNFEIIGEASKNLSEEVKVKNAGIPWKEMHYLRNRVMHEYFGIDYEIIWDIATNYLPQNKILIDEIIKEQKSKDKKSC
jgi:uncharacterized protein with HEPN domain